MSTSTFALPVRRLVPKTSVTLDPVFTLVYEDNKAALKDFLKDKMPLDLDESLRDQKFMDYILSKEPGPSVEYKNLRPALSAMRGFLDCSPEGKKLMGFYKYFLQLQAHWAIATAEMYLFETYANMSRALFIDHSDEKLLAHIEEVYPEGLQLVEANKKVDAPVLENCLLRQLNSLREIHLIAGEKLFDFKVSKDFFTQHGKLVTAIEVHEKKLEEVRERELRRKAARAARVKAAREANLSAANFPYQMGNVRVTNCPIQRDRLVQWVRDWRDKYAPGVNDEALKQVIWIPQDD